MARRALALLLLLGGACAPDVPTTASYDTRVIFPGTAFSGFSANGKGTFRVMFATTMVNPAWAVADPTVAKIEPAAAPIIPGADLTGMSFAVATMTKDGQTSITCTAGGRQLVAKLIVKLYTDDQLALGKARYESPSDDPTRPPCAACHAKAGGVDHSPLKMAGFDDYTILNVIQNATYPATAHPGQTINSAYAPKGPLPTDAGPAFHHWGLTDPEKDAIIGQLRSLPLGGLAPSQ